MLPETGTCSRPLSWVPAAELPWFRVAPSHLVPLPQCYNYCLLSPDSFTLFLRNNYNQISLWWILPSNLLSAQVVTVDTVCYPLRGFRQSVLCIFLTWVLQWMAQNQYMSQATPSLWASDCSSMLLPHSSVGKSPAKFDSWVGKIPWRKTWQPTPGFLPGESHGQRSLTGYSPRDRKRRTWLSD